MTLPGTAYIIYALAVAFYAALGAVYWFLGRRYSAVSYFEDAVMVLLYIFIVLFIDHLVSEVSTYLGVSLPQGEGVYDSLVAAASVFEDARQFTIRWILAVASLRAALSLTPLTSPLSYVLGSATSWSMTVFNMCAVSFLFYTVATRVYAEYYPVMLAIGAMLTPVPRARSIGGALLALVMVYTPALLYYAHIVQQALSSLPQPPSINPVEWANIAALASDAAIPLADLFVRGLVIVSIAGIIAGGLSRILAGTYTRVKFGV